MTRFAAAMLIATACGKAPTYPDVMDPAPSPDARVDGPGDSCNAVAQVGCNPGLKCTWTRTAATPANQHGTIECVPEGTVALDGACTWGAAAVTTGYDNCAPGLVCLAPIDQEMSMGTCAAICDVSAAAGAPGSCPDGFTCVVHAGYFANAGDPPTDVGLCDPS